MSDVDILNDRELDALASSSGDDVDMASVKCVVREVRHLRAAAAAMESVVEAAEEWQDARSGRFRDWRLNEAIDHYRATKKEPSK